MREQEGEMEYHRITKAKIQYQVTKKVIRMQETKGTSQVAMVETKEVISSINNIRMSSNNLFVLQGL